MLQKLLESVEVSPVTPPRWDRAAGTKDIFTAWESSRKTNIHLGWYGEEFRLAKARWSSSPCTMFFQSSVGDKDSLPCPPPPLFFLFLWLYQVIWPFRLQDAQGSHGLVNDQSCHQNCSWPLGRQQWEPFPFGCLGVKAKAETERQRARCWCFPVSLSAGEARSAYLYDNLQVRMEKGSRELYYILSAFSFCFSLWISVLKASIGISSSSLILSLVVSSLFVRQPKTFHISVTVF